MGIFSRDPSQKIESLKKGIEKDKKNIEQLKIQIAYYQKVVKATSGKTDGIKRNIVGYKYKIKSIQEQIKRTNEEIKKLRAKK